MRFKANQEAHASRVHPSDVIEGLDFEFDRMFNASSEQAGQPDDARTIDMSVYTCGEDGFILLMANRAGPKSSTQEDWYGLRHFFNAALLHKYLRDQQTKSPWGARVAADMLQLLIRSGTI